MTFNEYIDKLIDFKLKNQLTGEEKMATIYTDSGLSEFVPLTNIDLEYIKKENIEEDYYLSETLVGYDLVVI